MRRRLLPAAFAVALAGIGRGLVELRTARRRGSGLRPPTSSSRPRRRRRPGRRRSSRRAADARPSSWSSTAAGRSRPVASGLRGPGGAKLRGAVRVLRELTVPVTARSSAVARGLLGDVPDPLVPLSVRPAAASPRQVFWVSIAVPRSLRAGVYRGSVRAGGRSASYSLRVADVTLPRRRALHTWFLVWSTHADAAEHRPDAGPAYTRVTRRLRRRRRHRGGWRRGSRHPARQPPGGRLGRDVAGESRAGSPPLRRACARTCPMPCPTPTSSTSRRATSSTRCAAGASALAHDAPGVRQLVTAPPDPSLGTSVGAWAMHLRDLTPERARDDARPRRAGLGLLVVLRDTRATRRCCSTRMQSAISRSPRPPGSREPPASSTGR